jgi:hypothetical protein
VHCLDEAAATGGKLPSRFPSGRSLLPNVVCARIHLGALPSKCSPFLRSQIRCTRADCAELTKNLRYLPNGANSRLPRLGSRVRIPSPAPKIVKFPTVRSLDRIGAFFGFWGKQRGSNWRQIAARLITLPLADDVWIPTCERAHASSHRAGRATRATDVSKLARTRVPRL